MKQRLPPKMYPQSDGDFVSITDELRETVAQVAHLALRFETLAGRKLDISGGIGEILVADVVGLRLPKNPRTEGFDAIDPDGRRVEIKVRRSEVRDVPTNRGRTGLFSKHPYDYALLAILSKDYKIVELYKAHRRRIEARIRRKRKGKRSVSIGTFKRIGERVYPK